MTVVLIGANDTKKWIRKFKWVIRISNDKATEKLKVDIYVPLDACACEWDKFMNRVFVELTPYKKYINFDTKNLNSEEARELNIRNKCVVINGDKKFTSTFSLKRELPNILKAEGLI